MNGVAAAIRKQIDFRLNWWNETSEMIEIDNKKGVTALWK